LSRIQRFDRGRHAGVLVPLFSIPSERSWGIGEIGDLAAFAGWVRAAGHDLIQLLPVTEVAAGETSPYSAMTAMAIDPVYISIADVPEFQAIGGEATASPPARYSIDVVRRAPRIRYDAVRALKRDALRAAFEQIVEGGRLEAERADAFDAFVARERWWLDDYARFRTIREACGRPWSEWSEPLRNRESAALAAAGRDLAREIQFCRYVQWVADEQWRAAREQAGVGLFGDLPFMVSADSADVWARQDEFCVDVSVGTPPDAFSETGQNWGLPVYRWDVVEAGGYEWLRHRARRSAALYDGYRIDHVVGFYRTFVRPLESGPFYPPKQPRDFKPYFTPADEPEQRAQGERVLAAFRSADALVVAEDLGVIPDFVRVSLGSIGVPGFRVLRWDRQWEEPGRPFGDPRAWPARSVGVSGTHDTASLAEWWETAGAEERTAFLAIPDLASRGLSASAEFGPELRDAILETIFASGSDYVITPMQDLFGWRERINVPATTGPQNWTWRLPWPSDRILAVPEARGRAAAIAKLTERHGRSLLQNPESGPSRPNSGF
jgi:4-alpha-glucanotransferase